MRRIPCTGRTSCHTGPDDDTGDLFRRHDRCFPSSGSTSSDIEHYMKQTHCVWGDTICLRTCKLTISSHLFARWHLFRHVRYLRHQQQDDSELLTLKMVLVTGDVGYLCTNFSLPRPLCSRVRSNVRDRQTDRRQTKSSLNASTRWGWRHNNQSLLTTR